jgi:hypothetical protein
MPEKTLKITFSGINTLTPARIGTGTEKVYVMMPAARETDALMPQHHAFLYIPTKHLSGGAPDPADSVPDETLGRCNVYHVDHARVAFNQSPAPRPPRYHVTGLPIERRPGLPGVAPREDLRWTAALSDITNAGFLANCDPAQSNVSADVAMVVELMGGIFKANFPCATVQEQVFKVGDSPLNVPSRVYAPEFSVEMTYPEFADDIRLVFTPLTNGFEIEGVDGEEELVLRWESDRIDLRMGNDTTPEIQALINLERCNIRLNPRPRDNDFRLHYKIFDVPASQQAVPVAGTLHTEHNGCLPVGGP